jgi:hypothetical protein
MAHDIGRYVEQLTRKARSGRRLERDAAEQHGSETSSGATPATETAGSSGGGGLGDKLKDLLRNGRTSATAAAKTTIDRARREIDRRTSPKRRTTLPPEGVVTVEYSPRIDGDPDPGEVVWTWVPFEDDPQQGKDRPVVVIGRRHGGLVGVPLTSRQNDREAQIAIGTGDWDPKRRPSYARIWRMLDIEADRMRREGAILERGRFEDVVAAVDRYDDIRRAAPDDARNG